MRFEVKLPQRLGIWALRRAGLDTSTYSQRWFDVIDGKASYPIEISCPYISSEKPINIRLTVFVHHHPLFHVAVEVDDDIIGGKIQEQIVRYSIDNDGEAIAEQEHRLLFAKIDDILKRDGTTSEILQRKSVILSRPTLELLMQLCEEAAEYGRQGSIYWIFWHPVIAKADKVFVARWMVKFFTSEKDPFERGQISVNLDRLAVPEIADDLIQLIKDRRYGYARGGLCMTLAKTKDPRSAEVIASVLDEEGVTRWALECLGKLRAHAYVEAIRKFVRHPNSEIRREAKKALKKLGFSVDTPPPPIHLVKNRSSLPKGLEEWSANLDIENVKPTLEKLAQCVEEGFGTKEITEVIGVVDEMKHDQTKSFCFPIIAKKRENELWLIIFMDDIDSPDLAIHANSEVIQKFSSIVTL
jgi:hypothetical protein